MFQPILSLINNRALWGHVGLPPDEFRKLIEWASAFGIERLRIEKGDSLRLLDKAMTTATQLLEQNRKGKDVRQLLDQLCRLENSVAHRELRHHVREPDFSNVKRLKKQQQRVADYFEEIGSPIKREGVTYGRSLARFHRMERELMEPKFSVVRELLLQLRNLLPFDADAPTQSRVPQKGQGPRRRR
jgi:hypothetical protein